jgi:hypothetical protein
MCLTSKTCVVSSIDIRLFVHFQRRGVNTLMSSLFYSSPIRNPTQVHANPNFLIEVIASPSKLSLHSEKEVSKQRLHAFSVF